KSYCLQWFDAAGQGSYDALSQGGSRTSGLLVHFNSNSQANSRRRFEGVGNVSEIVVKDFLEAGIHYGHRTSRWNPKMRPYIYGRRNLIHIIDVKESVRGLLRAKRYLTKVASQGSLVLFCGTKKQAADTIRESATAAGMPYVDYRWLGGIF